MFLQLPPQSWELNILSRLGQFPKSIGSLKHLEKIVVNISYSIKTLPEEFRCLQSLKYLELVSCTALESLPTHFGGLTNLEHLDLSFCTELQMLRNSFGQLTKLQYLCFICCHNLVISSEILGKISSLEVVNFAGCANLEVLPTQITCQTSRRNLHLMGTSIKELPCEFGVVSNLTVLDLEIYYLTALPTSFGNLRLAEKICPWDAAKGLLSNLEYLSISFSPQRQLTFTKRLEQEETSNPINTSNCMFTLKRYGELEELPSLAGLSSLEDLDTDGCWKLSNVQGLQQLEQLNNIKISAGNATTSEYIQCLQDDVNYNCFPVPAVEAKSCSALITCFVSEASGDDLLIFGVICVCGITLIRPILCLSMESV
eukprot:Gb_01924 [translate_table: standard]